MKRTLFILVMVLLVLLVAELLTFGFFTAFKDKFTFYEIDQFLMTDSVISFAHQGHHAERGWDNQYATPFGERPRATDYNDPLIATFGDSFVHCDEVQDNETWQEYLSSRLEKDVYNFGTGGYGTDQAYLKYLEKYPTVKTPIVILGLTTENINRIVNVYRPFYYEKTGQRITKPRFKIVNDQLTLLKNPLSNKDEIEKLNSLRFIQEIGRQDYWYNRDNHPELRFPYIRILFNPRLWRDLTNKTDDIAPRPWIDLWEDKGSRELMFRILDAFAADVKAAGAIPIIMVIPNPMEIIKKNDEGREANGIVRIKEYCRQHHYLYFNPIDGFVDHVSRGRPLPEVYHDHITAQGNKIIAGELLNFLKTIEGPKDAHE